MRAKSTAGKAIVALVKGDVTATRDEPVLVRVHSHCLAGDVFAGSICDCHRSLTSLRISPRPAAARSSTCTTPAAASASTAPLSLTESSSIAKRERREMIVHQRTLRQVGLGGQILADLGIHRIRLLSNTPTHVPALQGFNIEIVEQVPILGDPLKTTR